MAALLIEFAGDLPKDTPLETIDSDGGQEEAKHKVAHDLPADHLDSVPS